MGMTNNRLTFKTIKKAMKISITLKTITIFMIKIKKIKDMKK